MSNSVDLKRTARDPRCVVREGANQISGPNLTIDKPDDAS
jgi:hypothetical protein